MMSLLIDIKTVPENIQTYGPDDRIVRVKAEGVGFISLNGNRYRVGGGFYGHDVAVRPTTEVDKYDIYFCAQKIKTIDLNHPDG
jgi:hypothetical protein